MNGVSLSKTMKSGIRTMSPVNSFKELCYKGEQRNECSWRDINVKEKGLTLFLYRRTDEVCSYANKNHF